MVEALREARENAEDPDYDGFEGVEAEAEDEEGERSRRIRCPVCRWQPQKHDRWWCTCGYVWNTFDTAALCPACKKQWEWTQCLKCHERSLHKDWYTDDEHGRQ